MQRINRWHIVAFSLLFSCYSCNDNVYISGEGTELSSIDLGLSVSWANMNLGANAPEDFGKFYALGGIEPYDSIPSDDDFVLPNNWFEWHDSLGVVLSEYDAASKATQGGWRIPTIEEWTELGNKCNWTWINYNGTEGFRVEGPNGNSIFLPAAGHTDSKYGDVPNGFYRCSFVWDGGAAYSMYFIKPKGGDSPIISLNEDLSAPANSNVWFDTYGCHVPASLRAVRITK